MPFDISTLRMHPETFWAWPKHSCHSHECAGIFGMHTEYSQNFKDAIRLSKNIAYNEFVLRWQSGWLRHYVTVTRVLLTTAGNHRPLRDPRRKTANPNVPRQRMTDRTNTSGTAWVMWWWWQAVPFKTQPSFEHSDSVRHPWRTDTTSLYVTQSSVRWLPWSSSPDTFHLYTAYV